MVAILDFTGEAAPVDIRNGGFTATGNIIGTNIVKITSSSQNMAISAVLYILAAILDSGDMIAKSTSGMDLQPLITHTKW